VFKGTKAQRSQFWFFIQNSGMSYKVAVTTFSYMAKHAPKQLS